MTRCKLKWHTVNLQPFYYLLQQLVACVHWIQCSGCTGRSCVVNWPHFTRLRLRYKDLTTNAPINPRKQRRTSAVAECEILIPAPLHATVQDPRQECGIEILFFLSTNLISFLNSSGGCCMTPRILWIFETKSWISFLSGILFPWRVRVTNSGVFFKWNGQLGKSSQVRIHPTKNLLSGPTQQTSRQGLPLGSLCEVFSFMGVRNKVLFTTQSIFGAASQVLSFM